MTPTFRLTSFDCDSTPNNKDFLILRHRKAREHWPTMAGDVENTGYLMLLPTEIHSLLLEHLIDHDSVFGIRMKASGTFCRFRPFFDPRPGVLHALALARTCRALRHSLQPEISTDCTLQICVSKRRDIFKSIPQAEIPSNHHILRSVFKQLHLFVDVDGDGTGREKRSYWQPGSLLSRADDPELSEIISKLASDLSRSRHLPAVSLLKMYGFAPRERTGLNKMLSAIAHWGIRDDARVLWIGGGLYEADSETVWGELLNQGGK